MKLPRVFHIIIKYVTPLFLVFILSFWIYQEGYPVLLLQRVAGGTEAVPVEKIPYIILTRVGLVLLFATLVVLVWVVWKRREQKQNLLNNK